MCDLKDPGSFQASCHGWDAVSNRLRDKNVAVTERHCFHGASLKSSLAADGQFGGRPFMRNAAQANQAAATKEKTTPGSPRRRWPSPAHQHAIAASRKEQHLAAGNSATCELADGLSQNGYGPGGSILGARTQDLASRGPRNLRSRGTLPPKRTPYMWAAAVVLVVVEPSPTRFKSVASLYESCPTPGLAD